MITKGRAKAAGRIYPEGTIAGDGFDTESAETIGRWLCRGWFLLNEDRPELHVVTTREYIRGEIKPNWLYPPDQLASSEKVPEIPTRRPVRSVIGGKGRYLGVKGEVHQHGLGTNTETVATLEVPAPNFRFVFRLS